MIFFKLMPSGKITLEIIGYDHDQSGGITINSEITRDDARELIDDLEKILDALGEH